ncbi:lanthionine synthetase C family protein [Ramlibacter algicola]|uniref:LanC-like protein n=1 Tax=Ramlibacter algicola TaxID=2795217 RepID=A0A934UQS8_9BURK|nr:LanC-like protein [Ramlibacter algicola]MBK0392994.1 LanC-like protein [Ramlibacter algicola]
MSAMFDPARHEALQARTWQPDVARDAIHRIVEATLADYQPGRGWATHPNDDPYPDPVDGLYFGTCGIAWALRYLHQRGVCDAPPDFGDHLRAQRGQPGHEGSYLFGEVPVQLLLHAMDRDPVRADRLEALIRGNLQAPERELMWGSPGTMLAALFMHRRTGEPRFTDLFRETADVLRGQLLWSDEFQCDYWTQDMYGQKSTYLDAVHGFVATACVLAQGRDLLPPADWDDWVHRIGRTVRATADREEGLANWRAWLTEPPGRPKLVQFCHGAPGFVICLADSPDDSLADLLLEAGETTWRAGPLRKGSNLCHGTGGNGYAFLKLFQRTGDEQWLRRARAFAMHGMAQADADHARFVQWRHGLWTGDIGLAIYLLDCIEGQARFPTLDVFDA